MSDYKNMSAKEALREAKDASGMTAEEIASGLGISASHMRRYLDAGDSYFPSLSMIPALCKVMRNTILLQWLEAQTTPEAPIPVSPAESRADVLTSVASAGAALGTVQGMLSGVKIIHPANAREIRSALGDVITACRRVQVQLQPVASARDRAECLACEKPEPKRSWWKKIRGGR